MTISQFLPSVKCTICESHLGMKYLPFHVCPCNQPHRFSQVSHYEDNNELLSQITSFPQKEPQCRPNLAEILAKKKRHIEKERANNYCCRCHHSKAHISIAEKNYHTHCFSCFFCRAPLDRDIPNVFDGQIYCSKHYQIVVTRPRCATCEQSIESFVRPTIALGRYFHPEHIRCYSCHKTVDPLTTGIKERKGKIYCQTDFNRLFLPKCESCKRAVEKEAVISVDGKLKGSWHKNCFKCQLCDTPFPNNQFYVYENAPYCKLDYHKMNNSLCRVCSQPIEGNCAETSNGWRFHPECYVKQERRATD